MDMKRFTFLVVMTMFVLATWAQTATSPSIGDGSSGNPYQVANLENLYWLSQNSSEWDKYFIQTADIDASATATWNLGDHDNDAGTPDEYMGFSPIGNLTTKFTGSFNGAGFEISNLFINRPATDQIGFFGYINDVSNGLIIKNICLRDVNITGDNKVGGLVGWILNSEIVGCSVTGNITGITFVGGLSGFISTGCLVAQCYSEGNIESSNFYAGGITGVLLSANISNSYSVSHVSGYTYVGGFAGYTQLSPTIDNCFSTGNISASTSPVGGFIAANNGTPTINNSFWDTETSGQSSSSGGTGKTTAEMTTLTTFTNAGWDFEGETTNGTDDYWGMYSYYNNGYPILLGVTPQFFVVVTNAATSITNNSATLNGDIPTFGDEGYIPTQHGFVWSSSSNPTLSDNKSEQGIPSSTGAYTYTLTGLMRCYNLLCESLCYK